MDIPAPSATSLRVWPRCSRRALVRRPRRHKKSMGRHLGIHHPPSDLRMNVSGDYIFVNREVKYLQTRASRSTPPAKRNPPRDPDQAGIGGQNAAISIPKIPETSALAAFLAGQRHSEFFWLRRCGTPSNSTLATHGLLRAGARRGPGSPARGNRPGSQTQPRPQPDHLRCEPFPAARSAPTLVDQNRKGDDRDDGHLDEGRADRQKPDFAFGLRIHG
jgi:hypothetical protein